MAIKFACRPHFLSSNRLVNVWQLDIHVRTDCSHRPPPTYFFRPTLSPKDSDLENVGSYHVFACFIDYSKAFDLVNYWKLFMKLIDDGVNPLIVNLLAYWYSNQTVEVRWQSAVSVKFGIGNGVRQGGVLLVRER